MISGSIPTTYHITYPRKIKGFFPFSYKPFCSFYPETLKPVFDKEPFLFQGEAAWGGTDCLSANPAFGFALPSGFAIAHSSPIRILGDGWIKQVRHILMVSALYY